LIVDRRGGEHWNIREEEKRKKRETGYVIWDSQLKGWSAGDYRMIIKYPYISVP
jgi:hypothetical protein